MRIVGGEWRGRRLVAPSGQSVRPTSDRAREALFNILANGRGFAGFDIQGAAVCDAFAGTGALGLEALSRGAARVEFIENDGAARLALRANIANLGAADRCEVWTHDATRPAAAPAACDLVLMDPPYDSDLAASALAALAAHGWLMAGAIVVLERSAKQDFAPPDGFAPLDDRKYGAARLLFLTYQADGLEKA